MAAPAPIHGGSATEATYRRLRAMIVACHLQPGAKVKLNALAARLEVSPGAVREALSRLSSEGLVAVEPQRGFFVAQISEEDLKDTYAARIDIESACLRRSIGRGDLEWESDLVGAFHRLTRTPEPSACADAATSDAWHAAHDHFHRTLVAACEVRSLLRLRQQLCDQAERYRRAAPPGDKVIRDTAKEHRAIFEAALARDVEACVRLTREHLEKTTLVIRAQLARNAAPREATGPARRRVSARA